MPTILAPNLRRSLEVSWTFKRLELGEGDAEQQEAYQELEWRRCAESFLYFIDRYGMILDKEKKTVAKWEMWPVQRELGGHLEAGESICAPKCRQIAVTTECMHFAGWQVIFRDMARWYIVSADEGAAKDALERWDVTIRNIEEKAPWILERARARATVGDAISRKDKVDSTLMFKCGMSYVQALTSTKRKLQGKAATGIILDEFSQHDPNNQEVILRHAFAAAEGGGQLIVIANGNGEDAFYYLYQRSKEGKTGLKPMFFDWRCDPRRDDNWYQQAMEKFIISKPEADEYEFRQQYPSNENEAFFLTGNSRFSQYCVNWHAQRMHDEKCGSDRGHLRLVRGDTTAEDRVEFDKKSDGALTVWEHPVLGAKYIVSCDPAGGQSDGNYTVNDVWRLAGNDIEQVAQYRSKIEPVLCALRLEHIGRYYNDALLAILRNNHGHSVISHVKNHYFNLYQYTDYSSKIADEFYDNIGYPENKATKHEMIDELADLLDVGTKEFPKVPRIVIRSPITIKELSTYERKDGEKLGAKGKGTDDCVSSAGMAAMAFHDYYSNQYGGKDFDSTEW